MSASNLRWSSSQSSDNCGFLWDGDLTIHTGLPSTMASSSSDISSTVAVCQSSLSASVWTTLDLESSNCKTHNVLTTKNTQKCIKLKGIVHSKMKILSMYSLSCCYKPVNVFVLITTKDGMFIIQPIMSPIDFKVEKKYYGSDWSSWSVWFQTFLKIFSFVVIRRK